MRQALPKFDASEPHFVDKGSLDDVFEMISYNWKVFVVNGKPIKRIYPNCLVATVRGGASL